MKKTFLSILMVCLTLGLSAQEYNVSTKMQKKNVLIEEFTGVRCPNCPAGHRAVASLKKAYGDRVSAVAIHTRSYSITDNGIYDLTVPEGEAVARVVGGSGPFFPNCIVSRRDWDGDGRLHMGVNSMKQYSEQAFNEDAPVNLWAKAVLNENTLKMEVQVEGYFTQDISGEMPRLNLYVTQNNVLNVQSGGNMDDKYVHNHLFRDVITNASGDMLNDAKKGTYFTKTYTYQVPKSYKMIAVNNKDLELIVFVTKGTRDVENAVSIRPTLVRPLGAVIHPYKVPVKGGYRYNFVDVEVDNLGEMALNTITFDVTLNGVTKECEWKGNIPGRQSADIRIPVDWDKTAVKRNKFTIEMKRLNGQDTEKSSFSGSFGAPNILPPDITLEIYTDNNASENTYRLCNMSGEVLKTFGPYPDGEAKTYVEKLNLQPDASYCLELLDAKGDGIHSNVGLLAAFIDENGKVIYSCSRVTDYGWRMFFQTKVPTGIEQLETVDENDFQEVYNTAGQRLGTIRKLKDLPRGVYIVRSSRGCAKVYIR